MPACPLAYLSACLLAYLSACLLAYLSACLLACLPAWLSACHDFLLIRRLFPLCRKLFLCSNSKAYFVAVQFGLLLQCAYASLWISNFAMLAVETEYPGLWMVAVTIPMGVCYWLVCKVSE